MICLKIQLICYLHRTHKLNGIILLDISEKNLFNDLQILFKTDVIIKTIVK